MLREISSTHQNNRNQFKRWFTDSDMDLFIWFKNRSPVCFQLCYNKCQQERSVSWHIDNGFSHNLIRPKNHSAKYRIPATPSPEVAFNAMAIAREFLQASDHIDTALTDFIFSRLLEYPAQLSAHSDQAPVSENSQWARIGVPVADHRETTSNAGIYSAP